MILRDFSRIITEDLGALCPMVGDDSRTVNGLAVDEGDIESNGWLEPGEIVISNRDKLGSGFLKQAQKAGSPALVWRTDGQLDEDTVDLARKLGIGLFTLAPQVPLKRLFSVFSVGNDLLLRSHTVSKTLLESAGGEASIRSLAEKVSDLLKRSIAVEDSVGRLLTSAGESTVLTNLLEETELRASKSASVDETCRERRDRYARLPDGFLSVPVERWRVENNELFWMPLGSGAPVGYLWMDLEGHSLTPEDVVLLYWARRILETELGKERVRLEAELGARGDFVDDLVNGHYGSVDLLLQRARYLGADLSSGALALIVDIDDFANYLERRKLKESAIQELKKRLADAVRLQARQALRQLPARPPLGQRNTVHRVSRRRSQPEEIPDGARPAGEPDTTLRQGPPARPDDLYRHRALHRRPFRATGRLLRSRGRIGDRAPHPRPLLYLDLRGNRHLQAPLPRAPGGPGRARIFLQRDPGPRRRLRLPLRHGAGKHPHDLPAQRRLDRQDRYRAVRPPAHHPLPAGPRRRADGLDVDKSEDRESLTLGIKVMQLLGRVPEKPSSFSDR